MINADISNIWGDIALQDLLAQEGRILEAHTALFGDCEQPCPLRSWLELPEALPEELNKIVNLIRLDSDILIVIGDNGATRGTRAIIELLQGPHRNWGKGQGDPMIVFVPDNRSPSYWNQLNHLLEGRDYSLCVIAPESLNTGSAIALRNLKWMLERKYGTNDAMCRIYAVTCPGEGTLRAMAQEENWKIFDLPEQCGEDFSLLCPSSWLPLAVAGIDVEKLLHSIRSAREEYSLGSFDDNPAWLYTAVRKLMSQSRKTIQLLTSFEPGMAAFGEWWQGLFAAGGPESGAAAPLAPEMPAGQRVLDRLVQNSSQLLFETMLRFESPEKAVTIAQDKTDLDGLQFLAGKDLADVQEEAFFRLQEAHADSGTAVMTLECPRLCEETLGELIWFFQLSRALELMM